MKIYKSPIYPALMIRLPDGGARASVKAAGGYFNVPNDQVEEFEKIIAARPEYRVEYVGTGPDPVTEEVTEVEPSVTEPEAVSPAELEPEIATFESLEQHNVPTLREMLEERGLPSEGRKADLIERLIAADGETDGE